MLRSGRPCPTMVRMAGEPQFGPAPDPGAAQRAQTPLTGRDPLALRESISSALLGGEGPGAVYARLVRPLFAEPSDATVAGGGGPIADERRALARSSAQ